MFDELARWLPDCGADVLCVQEVTRTPDLRDWTRFADGERSLPQRANLFGDIESALPEHGGVFVASDSGPVRDPDGRRHVQDFGIATFVHGDVTVVEQRAGFVHGEYLEHDEWPLADRPRIAHATRLVDPSGEGSVVVAHLHGLRDPGGKGDSAVRLHQAERLVALVETVRQADDFVVVCGDLNVLPDSVTFDVLGAAGLVDLVGTADTRTSRYPKDVRHANYMLVSDPTVVSAFDAPPTPEVSDHRFLVLDF